MNRLNTFIASLLLLTILSLHGCFSSDDIPDVSDISVDLDKVNYDDVFLNLKPGDDLKSEIEVLKTKYPLTQVYIDYVMQLRDPRDTTDAYIEQINEFLSNAKVQEVKVDIDSVYSNRADLDHDFEQAFQYLKYYFPEKETPRLYYLMSGFNVASFVFLETETQDGLGISLDMFLGNQYPYKDLFPTNPAFSSYLTATFDRAYVVKKGMDAIINDLVGQANGQRLIDQMVHNGKRQYLLDKLLPTAADSIKWEYTAAQMSWVVENELNLYSHFTSQKMLYSDDQMKYTKFINPSPNSPGLPEEAPGRTANYIGYKIVQAYMKQSGSDLQTLIDEKDTQTILNIARYKPRL